MNYLEYTFVIHPPQPWTEILIAELGEAGFESFVETEMGVSAYIQKVACKEDILKDISTLKSELTKIEYHVQEIEQINWNAEWEKNFNPISVNNRCIVRASFHPKGNHKYDIIIQPKMSFGTGHHETTFMMLQFILENDLKGKEVLDMGCGTAVLAILASKCGVKKVDAVDIDEWCVENSLENILINDCSNISVFLGDSNFLLGRNYNVILANINRNILLNDLDKYVNTLKESSEIYLSGFYTEDLPMIVDACNNIGVSFVENKSKNNWVAAKFKY